MHRFVWMMALATWLGAMGCAPSFAESTGWMPPSAATQFLNQSVRGGKGVLNSVQCKDSGGFGRVNDITLVRLNYKIGKFKTKWSWGVGDKKMFETYVKKNSDKRRVSYGRFVRPGSGKTIECAVWHG